MKTNVKNTLLSMFLMSGAIPCNAFLAPKLATLTTTVEPSIAAPTLPSPALNSFRPATALQASLVDRFFRVARGNLNAIVAQYEDPEKVMEQALVDMQNDITKIRQTYAEVTAGQRRLLSQKNQYESVANDWYRRAQLAIKSSNEGLAREALARREQALQKASSIQQQVDSQAANLDKLYEGMKTLEAKVMEAQTKKNELAARAKTAKSTAWINDMLSGLSGKTSMDAFRRMEDKVAALEATAEVSAEMLNGSLLSASADDTKGSSKMDIELEFRRLEASDAVDREFQKLKAANMPASENAKMEEAVRIPITEHKKEFILN